MADNFKDMIVLEPASPWDGGSWTDPVGELGRTRYAIVSGEVWPSATCASKALESAYNTLQGFGGGTLRIMQGTSRYKFDHEVDLLGGKPVTIIQDKGAICEQTGDCVYVVKAANQLEWKNFQAQYDVGATTSGRSFFRVVHSLSSGIAAAIGTTGSGEMTIARDAGSWIADGAAVGMRVRSQDYANTANNTGGAGNGANNGGWIVLEVTSATVLTCRDVGDVAVGESSAGGGTVTLLDRAADFRLTGGHISLAQTNAAVPGYYVVRVEGSDADLLSPGVTIRDVTLEIRNWSLPTATKAGNVTQSTNSWTGTEYTSTPYGIGLLKAINCRAVDVTGCKYIGQDAQNTSNYGGVFINLDSCLECNLSGFVISSINTSSSATGKAALPLFLFTTNFSTEGGHTLLSNVFAENIIAKHLVAVSNAGWLRVFNTVCGRWSSAKSRSMIRALDGRSIQVLASNTHNYQGFDNSGDYDCSTSTQKFTGTNISEGFEEGMFINVKNFSAAVDGLYKVAAVGGPNEWTADTTFRSIPENVTGDSNEQCNSQPWVCDFDAVNDYFIDIQDHTFRKSKAPLHRITNSTGFIGTSEFIDYGPLSYA